MARHERALGMMADSEMAAPKMREESLFEYHLYTLERPTTVAENQTKQVALLSGSKVPVGERSTAWRTRRTTTSTGPTRSHA